METNRLHSYYERELAYLQHQASRFANVHAPVASRLALQAGVIDEFSDPHVKRLMEAFAILSGRIRKKLDDDLPELSETLLNVLFPHLLAPIPSMGIAEMQPMEEQGRFDTVLTVRPETRLTTHQVDGRVCRFKNCYEVEVWPMRVAGVELEDPPTRRGNFPGRNADSSVAIRLKFETLNAVKFSALSMGRLRLHFGGVEQVANELYRLFLHDLVGIEVLGRSEGSACFSLGRDAVKPVGFSAGESLLPFPSNVAPGYRILMEYFVYPRKFLFVDIEGLDPIEGSDLDEEMELLFHFSGTPKIGSKLSKADFRLGCTPIVNLFDMRAAPIDVDQRHYEYPVIPVRGERGRYDIYSINGVKALLPGSSRTVKIAPVYSYQILSNDMAADLFWNVSRAPADEEEEGSTKIAFVDHGLRPKPPERLTVVTDITCTNRNDPATWPFGSDPSRGDFTIEESPHQIRILCASTPEESTQAVRKGDLQWRLISHLSLNHLSISEGSGEALKALLTLYNFKKCRWKQEMLEGISGMKSRRVNRLIGRHMVSGLEIEIELEASALDANRSVLFCEVLNRFFGLYASINSFTQLVVKTVHRDEDDAVVDKEVKKWRPRTGQLQLG